MGFLVFSAHAVVRCGVGGDFAIGCGCVRDVADGRDGDAVGLLERVDVLVVDLLIADIHSARL
jgi:hypothetical protein